jgi:hypothetical protein
MKLRYLLLSAVCLASFSGCGGSTAGGPKIVPVAGVVSYKNAPVANADLVFYPENGPAGIGKTDAAGKFQIKTNGQLGGVPGKNKVTVGSKQESAIPPSDGRAIEFAKKSTLPKKYSSEAETDLVLEITATGNPDLKLDLTD